MPARSASRHGSRRPVLAGALVSFLAAATALRADVVHLKNGGTIQADSWEERGDKVVIHQGRGTVIVPRADIERIEKVPRAGDENAAPSKGSPKQAPDPDAREPAVALGDPAAGGGLSTDQILSLIDDLKRRIRDYPMARTENTRQLVGLLCRLGSDAYRKRDYDGALPRFREALGYDPHDARAALGLAATYASQGQDIYARSTLEQALVDHPDDAELLTLMGDVYNSQERPEDALDAWQKAYARKPDVALKRRIDKLQREHAIDGSYRRSEAAHFTLKYDGERGGPDLESQILDDLEAAFPDLVTRFDYVPRQPIVVIVYPQRQFYEATLAESNVAGLFDGKIRVPIGGLKSLNSEARKVLVHELAHAFITGKSHGTAPRWLHEGIAQQIEGKAITPALGLPLAKEYQALGDKSSWGTTFSYPSALSFVEFLVEREGFPHLVDALDAMGDGASADAAFERVTHYSLQELRQAWGEALVAKYLQ